MSLMIKCIFQQPADPTSHLNAAIFGSLHGRVAQCSGAVCVWGE